MKEILSYRTRIIASKTENNKIIRLSEYLNNFMVSSILQILYIRALIKIGQNVNSDKNVYGKNYLKFHILGHSRLDR